MIDPSLTFAFDSVSEQSDPRPILDVRRCIDTYHLDQCQLAFSVAEITDSGHGPIIYDSTTVFSNVISAKKSCWQPTEQRVRCVPSYGDVQGDEPVFLFIPSLDRRKGREH